MNLRECFRRDWEFNPGEVTAVLGCHGTGVFLKMVKQFARLSNHAPIGVVLCARVKGYENDFPKSVVLFRDFDQPVSELIDEVQS